MFAQRVRHAAGTVLAPSRYRLGSAALVLAACFNALGCGPPASPVCSDVSCLGRIPKDDVEAREAGLALVVGTHHYLGTAYQCGGDGPWFQPEGKVTITNSNDPDPAGGFYWHIKIEPELRYGSFYNVNWSLGSTWTAFLHDAGTLAYNVGSLPGYVHENSGLPIEWSHVGTFVVADIQVFPPDSTYSYGKVNIALSPAGGSVPGYGECAERVLSTLAIQSS